jgi:hypothetical protein
VEKGLSQGPASGWALHRTEATYHGQPAAPKPAEQSLLTVRQRTASRCAWASSASSAWSSGWSRAEPGQRRSSAWGSAWSSERWSRAAEQWSELGARGRAASASASACICDCDILCRPAHHSVDGAAHTEEVGGWRAGGWGGRPRTDHVRNCTFVSPAAARADE